MAMWRRLGSLFSGLSWFPWYRRRARDADLARELRDHLELETEEQREAGLSPKEAGYAAHRALGNTLKIEEDVRAAWGFQWLETLVQDIRYALRTLRKSPGFTAVAILTLALGIGANTAIFSILDALVFRTLPVPHPEQIVHLGAHAPGNGSPLLSAPLFEEIARDQKFFSSMFAWWGDGVWNVEANSQRLRTDVWAVTGNFYAELGASPTIGRLITPSDVDMESPSPAQVAVLGYQFWQNYYGGQKSALGKTLKIEGVPFTIIGVARKGFKGMDEEAEPEVTVPLPDEPLIAGDDDVQKALQGRDNLWLDAAGRLRPRMTLTQARAQINSIWPAVLSATAPFKPNERNYYQTLQPELDPFATGYSFLRGDFVKPTYVLLAIAGMLLLLACVNLASLELSRAATRAHEFGVRVALGANRFRLIQQVLVESVMLSLLGALAGIAFADWGSHALASFVLGQYYNGDFNVSAELNVSPDLRILVFTAVIAILTGVFFGLAPAWRSGGEDPNTSLQQSSRTAGRGAGKLGKGLTVAQVALSLVLVSGAGLFIRTLEKLRAVQPGFRVEGILEVQMFPVPNAFKNADRVSYFHELTERVSHLPGVVSAGIEHMQVGSSFVWTEKVRAHGATNGNFSSDCEMAMPGFFRTEDISLLQGRTFDWADGPKATSVAIVSLRFAEKMFPHGNAIGQQIDITDHPKWQRLRIVGIVRDVSLYDIRKKPQPTVYLPTLQYGDWADDDEMLIRTSISPVAIVPEIRHVFDSVGRESIVSATPLSQTIDRSILQERITAMLSAFFGALALLLAAIGLFGLMAYNVTRRTRELGIRFALGAQRSTVLRMILRETLILTLIGTAVGIPCALAATRLIAHMLFGVRPYDPVTLVAVTLVFLAVGLLAGCIPARRAMRVDPMVALRYE